MIYLDRTGIILVAATMMALLGIYTMKVYADHFRRSSIDLAADQAIINLPSEFNDRVAFNQIDRHFLFKISTHLDNHFLKANNLVCDLINMPTQDPKILSQEDPNVHFVPERDIYRDRISEMKAFAQKFCEEIDDKFKSELELMKQYRDDIEKNKHGINIDKETPLSRR